VWPPTFDWSCLARPAAGFLPEPIRPQLKFAHLCLLLPIHATSVKAHRRSHCRRFVSEFTRHRRRRRQPAPAAPACLCQSASGALLSNVSAALQPSRSAILAACLLVQIWQDSAIVHDAPHVVPARQPTISLHFSTNFSSARRIEAGCILAPVVSACATYYPHRCMWVIQHVSRSCWSGSQLPISPSCDWCPSCPTPHVSGALVDSLCPQRSVSGFSN
jgi:hypothetical protein